MIDLDDWGRPENLGLRQEQEGTLAVARKGGVAAVLIGAAVWVAGAVVWPGELAFLASLDSLPGRIGAGLLLGGGALALVVARLRFGDAF